MKKVVIPDIADPTEDYLVRYRLIQTPWFGVYLHKILLPDNDINLHDHPWDMVSVILSGGYKEIFMTFKEQTYDDDGSIRSYRGSHQRRHWTRWSVHSMKGGGKYKYQNDLHKIISLDKTPTWTLLFVGPRKRQWGYQTKDGWVARKDYDWHKYNSVH